MKTELIYRSEIEIKPTTEIKHHANLDDFDGVVFRVYDYWESLNDMDVTYHLTAEDALRYIFCTSSERTYKIEKITK